MTINNPASSAPTHSSPLHRNEAITTESNSTLGQHDDSIEKIDTVVERGGSRVVFPLHSMNRSRVSRMQTNGTRRVSRIESLTRTATRVDQWSHPLSAIKSSLDCVVDFDGIDDPYRPMNWPFRKKVVTTLLYGFTTMGSTWATAVSVSNASMPLLWAN